MSFCHTLMTLCFDHSGMMTDKRMDVDKHVLNMGEYGKNAASRHQIHKDAMDRSNYFDKVSSVAAAAW